MSRNVWVNEEGLKAYNNQVSKRMRSLNGFITNYIAIIDSVCQNAVTDGAFHDKLQAFKEAADVLKNQPELLSQQISNKICDYIYDMDKADRYIY